MTASPRNTCVPGVQACATLGVMATAMIATTRHWTTRPPLAAGVLRLASDPKALPLSPDGPTKILELRLDNVVDRLTSSTHVIRDAIADLLPRNRVPQVFTPMRRPARAGAAKPRSTAAGPSRTAADAAHYRRCRSVT
jgi:hypothetical protein